MEAFKMYSKFLNLDEDKQHRIINAAIKEFAQKGFEKASTNEIVKEAEISKGLLFHYFKNKEGLFLYLYDYFIDTLLDKFYAKLDFDECDLLEKYRQIVLYKFDLLKKHPDMFQFIKIAYEEEKAEIKYELEKRNKELIASSYAKVFKNIDTSKFKEGIDIKRTIDIITWTMEGFSHRNQEKTKHIPLDQINWDDLLADLDQFIHILKLSFYK
jgi:TetR/AcrR family transcriptional regulator